MARLTVDRLVQLDDSPMKSNAAGDTLTVTLTQIHNLSDEQVLLLIQPVRAGKDSSGCVGPVLGCILPPQRTISRCTFKFNLEPADVVKGATYHGTLWAATYQKDLCVEAVRARIGCC